MSEIKVVPLGAGQGIKKSKEHNLQIISNIKS